MSELLAPAGNMEALKAAVANGADAVYLGMQKFGARAYSNNFDEEGMREAVAYAHLRGVKVYVTINTIVFQDELPAVKEQLHFLNSLGVDGVIVQDLAVLDYVARNFADMQAHCSTQMGIDDVEGATLAKALGARRVVVAREAGIDRVKQIRAQAEVPVEVFIHGALCISYSGNCIMSSLTGNRSGNRGRCIGSCRKLYDVLDAETGEKLGQSYILSAKDLNTIDHVEELAGVDSLKIEGRMKEPVYVANVVSRYRKALDGVASADDNEKLNRTFNRSFTPGYIFGEDRGNITNIDKPNNFGFRIGAVAGQRKGLTELRLERPLKQNDVIRIQHGSEEVNLSVAKMYDAAGMLVNGAESQCFIKVKEKLAAGDVVYKTKDVAYTKELEGQLEGEFRRFPLDLDVYAYPGAPLTIDARGLGCAYTYVGEDALSEAKNKPTTLESVTKQMSKLNDTVFCLGTVSYEDNNAFVPVGLLNEARRTIVDALYQQKLASQPRAELTPKPHEPLTFQAALPYLTASVTTQEQFDACKEAGISCVWFDNVVPRNGNVYKNREGQLLIGGMGGIQRYARTNPFVTDYSLNVVNAESCWQLHNLGAQRVTLSYEINQGQLRDLLEAYQRNNGGSPALEMIVYGHAPLLVTKYCPLKKLGRCGECRTRRFQIREEFGTFPILNHENCDTTILNGKVLNLLDEMPSIQGVEAFRLNFTIETPNQVRNIIEKAKGKLAGTLTDSVFDSATDTRGHFNREIM